MRNLLVALLLVVAPIARADPRDVAEASVLGGVAQVVDPDERGEERFGLYAFGLAYERHRVAGYVRLQSSWLSANRISLDQPSFDEYGYTETEFRTASFSMSGGFEGLRGAIELTLGVLTAPRLDWDGSRAWRPVAAVRMRVGLRHGLSLVAQFGSRDNGILDRTLAMGGGEFVHARFRLSATVGTGYLYGPPLLSSADAGPHSQPLGRRETSVLFVRSQADIVARIEGGAVFGRHYLGGELWVGEQLPSLRLVFRESFGAEARERTRRRGRTPSTPYDANDAGDPDRTASSVITP